MANGHRQGLDSVPPVERVVTLLAWAVWEGDPELTVADLLALNDEARAAAI